MIPKIMSLACALAAGCWAAAAPVITGATPDPIDAGGPYFQLTITGSGFGAGATAKLAEIPLSTTVVSATELRAAITPEIRAVSGHPVLTVVNNGGAISNGWQVHISPVLAAISPSAAVAGSGAVTVTVTGIGFHAGDVLLWNVPGHPAVIATTFVNSGKLTAVIAADFLATAASAGVQVAEPAYDIFSASLPFDVLGTPAITSFSPNPVDAGGVEFLLSVNGSGFAAHSVVNWAGVPLGTTFVSDTKLLADITPALRALSGTFSITVSHPGFATSNTAQVTVSPVLFGINVTSAPAGSPAVNLTVTGAGFTRSSTIIFNAAALPTTHVSSTELSAVIPAASLANPGFAAVQVLDSTGSGRSLPLVFTVVGIPVPAIASLSPPSGTAGSGSFTLVVNGANCPAGCVVQWNGTTLNTTYPSATSVSAAVPGNLIASAGIASVQLVHQYARSNTAAFTIYPAAAVLTRLNPPSVASGSAAFPLTVFGSGFVQGSLVQWNGAGLPTSYLNTGQVTGFVAADLVTLHAGAGAGVSVVNPGGAVSNALTFGIDPPQPTLLGLSPSSGPAGAAALNIVLTGTNFAANCVVRWNGVAVGTGFVDAGRVTASIPDNLLAIPGGFPVTVTNPSGLGTAPVTFTVMASTPVASGMKPSSAVAGAAAFNVAVTGMYFTPSSAVLWNGTPLATSFGSPTLLSASVPAGLTGAASTVAVTVSNPGGLVSQGLSFTVTPAPPPPLPLPAVTPGGVVNAFSGEAAIAPGALISIYGTGFGSGEGRATSMPLPKVLNGVSVTIDGVAAPLLFVSERQINAQVPFEVGAGPGGQGSSVLGSGSGGQGSGGLGFGSGGQAGRPVLLLVQNGAGVQVELRAVVPGILTVDGGTHALAVNVPGDGLNSAGDPVRPGEYLAVYLTGQGMVDRAVASGAAAPSEPVALALAAVRAKIGGKAAEVAFAGLAPGFVGLLQVNLLVPDIAAGDQPLELTVGDVAANTSMVSIAPIR